VRRTRKGKPARPRLPKAVLSEYMAWLGTLGGAKGGHARAKALSAKERTESARMAAKARWAKRRRK
jgi:hypothetical protein